MYHETVLLEMGIEIASTKCSLCKLKMQYAQHEYLRYLSSHSKFTRYFFAQHIHIPTYLVVGDFRINLGRRDMLVA